jgi:L-threonylcarbamoyladenylate synthase
MAVSTERLQADAPGIARAAELLRAGGTVAFPTETVYGLGANALNVSAVGKIFAAKQRPAWDPLIVHVESRAMLAQIVECGPELTRAAEALMDAFWPGPLTLLLPRSAAVPDAVTAGRPLVGVRIPLHPVALELIRLATVPIAAPSANRFGGTSPTTAGHVLADLDGRIDAVLDGGPTSVGVESTVFDVAASAIYRPGAITAEMIARVLGRPVSSPSHAVTSTGESAFEAPEGLLSPGMGIRHYAPRARLILVADQRELLAEIAGHDAAEIGVMLPDGWDAGTAAALFPWGGWGDAETLARRLYSGLRTLDAHGVNVIVCPLPSMGGLGEALRDRLEKAARQN